MNSQRSEVEKNTHAHGVQNAKTFLLTNVHVPWLQRSVRFEREKKVSDENLIASRQIKRKKASLPVDVRRSKTSLLKFPNPC